MSLSRPSVLFLDLDGTLCDSRRDIAIAANAARAAHGLSALPEERLYGMIGDGARLLLARAFEVSEDDPLLDDAVERFKESYLEFPCVHTTLLRGARELIAAAVDRKIPCTVITNKPRAVALVVLERLGVGKHFPAIWAGGDGPLKPSPAGLFAMATRLDVDVKSAWMIGDGPQDVGAGKSAGCVTIGVFGIGEHAQLIASEPTSVCQDLLHVVTLLDEAGSADGG